GNTEAMMAGSTGLLLLLLLVEPWAGAAADQEAVVCAGAACYTAHRVKLSAEDAQLHCSKKGGNLATVKSEEEALHVQGALAQLLPPGAPLAERMGRFWIGLQRDKGKCLDSNLPLKGFSWVGGGEDTSYTNWHKEAKNSCTSKRCVSLMLDLSVPALASRLSKWTEGPCGSSRFSGSNIEGFVCKFSFKGMCRPLTLGGPGQVNYTTPFQATSSSLQAVPFASMANDCVDMDECQDAPCAQECVNTLGGFRCECWGGYVLAGEDGTRCVDVDECAGPQGSLCDSLCFNTEGSFRCGCLPGWELSPDGVSCTGGLTSLGPPAGPPQGEDTGDGEGRLVSFATTSSPTRDSPEGTSTVAPAARRPSLPDSVPISPAPPDVLAPSGSPGVWMEASTHHPTATTGREASAGEDFTAQQSDDGTDGQKLLLFYILGTVVAILLLLALALGLLSDTGDRLLKLRRPRDTDSDHRPQRQVPVGSRTPILLEDWTATLANS
ncbi:hypothetical protein E2I00_017591, partial [Balaenoptera physalus]